jgi:hypothetical protein
MRYRRLWGTSCLIFPIFPIKNKLMSHLPEAKTEAYFLMGVIPQHLQLCKFDIEVKLWLTIARISQVVRTLWRWAENKEVLLYEDAEEEVSFHIIRVHPLTLRMVFLIRY